MAARSLILRGARALSPKVRELTFDPGPGFSFEPGQWVSVEVPYGAETIARSYSIASAPRADRTFDVAVTRVEGGPGSGFLHAMEVGATIGCAEPRGFFTLPASLARPLVFVATGTGVAPFRAMVQALERHPDPPAVTLLFGVREEIDVLCAVEFDATSREHPWFTFAPTLSRGAPSWRGRRGYVQSHLADVIDGRDVDVFVCGLNAMVREARRTLRETLGLPRERVHSERYD